MTSPNDPTPPPHPNLPPVPPVPPPPPPATFPPPVPATSPPPASPPPVTSAHAPGAAGNQAVDRIVTTFKNVDWKQLGADLKTFGERFAASDFAKIHPKPHELPAVAAFAPRMAALMVWRRALLILACILTVILAVKSCFDSHTFVSQYEETGMKKWTKAHPNAKAEEVKAAREEIKAETEQQIKQFGESNIKVVDSLSVAVWVSIFVSLGFIVLAVKDWRDWRKSRKWAVWAVGSVLGMHVIAMLVPWGAMMNFNHIPATPLVPGFNFTQKDAMKLTVEFALVLTVLNNALPFLYGLVNGILRASLSAKTLIPASIVCGWSSILLAVAIAVPWFVAFSVVDQLELDSLIVFGVFCLLAAPLSIVVKSRRLGLPLTPEEATPLVKRTKLILTGLNLAGMAMILSYLLDKEVITKMDVGTLIVHYFANLMLVQVVAVDLLVLLLDRAHRKLAADAAPDEPLRQLGEVLKAA